MFIQRWNYTVAFFYIWLNSWNCIENFFFSRKLLWLWLLCIPKRTIITSKCIQMDGFSLYFHHFMSQEQRTKEILCNWVSSFPVQHNHPADLLTYCYVHKVAHLLWIFIEVFLGRKRLGCRRNVCYHCYLSGAFGGVGNLTQYHFVAVCACVSASVLRMFSHSYRCVLGCASAPSFYQCNSFLLCIL